MPFYYRQRSAPPPPPKKYTGPLRPKKNPPTIAEALFAAQSLTSDPAEQISFAAALMNISPEEVRPYLLKLLAAQRQATHITPQNHRGRERLVVVEKTRSSRFSLSRK